MKFVSDSAPTHYRNAFADIPTLDFSLRVETECCVNMSGFLQVSRCAHPPPSTGFYAYFDKKNYFDWTPAYQTFHVRQTY
jgi:hypothetical protein